MQIEVKDKYTGKNIKEKNSEIPDAPKAKNSKNRRRKIPIGLIIVIAAIVGIIAGIIIAINVFTKKSELVGTWIKENERWTYEFNEDGTGSFGLFSPRKFHYKDNGDSVEITFDKDGSQRTVNYQFQDGDLILENVFHIKETYKRKE